MNKTFVITLITVFTLVNMNAQEIITDRPDQTESSSTVPQGKLQWETGFSWERLKADYPNNDLFYSAVLGISHTEKLSSFWEFYAFRHEMLEDLVYYEAGLSMNDLRADFGFTYLVRPNLQLDLSSGLGFSKISPDFFISTGLSWRIPD